LGYGDRVIEVYPPLVSIEILFGEQDLRGNSAPEAEVTRRTLTGGK
jgi:hypothetical protein